MGSDENSRAGSSSRAQLPRYKIAHLDNDDDRSRRSSEHNRTMHPLSPQNTNPRGFASQGSPTSPWPVEPSPPLERTPTSPTLEQYHHPASPAEVKRRQSFAAPRASPPPVLAPIQSPTHSITSPTTASAQGNKKTAGEANKTQVGAEKPGTEITEAKEQDALGSEQKKNSPAGQTGEDDLVQKSNDSLSVSQPLPGDAGSPTTEVKAEASQASLGSVPPTQSEESLTALPSTEDGLADGPPPAKKVADLKRDNSRASSAEMSSTPAPKAGPKTAGTKRKAPAPGKKVEKKGIAKPSAAKKRKLDDDDAASSARRTGSPASSRASKPPASKNAKQPQSVAGSPPPEEEDEDVDDDDIDENQLFCICRKPDDHSYMIGCDGVCEDWFHGKCVNIRQEDGELIDKYICKSTLLHLSPKRSLPITSAPTSYFIIASY